MNYWRCSGDSDPKLSLFSWSEPGNSPPPPAASPPAGDGPEGADAHLGLAGRAEPGQDLVCTDPGPVTFVQDINVVGRLCPQLWETRESDDCTLSRGFGKVGGPH